jgi:hypothetical protein
MMKLVKLQVDDVHSLIEFCNLQPTSNLYQAVNIKIMI